MPCMAGVGCDSERHFNHLGESSSGSRKRNMADMKMDWHGDSALTWSIGGDNASTYRESEQRKAWEYADEIYGESLVLPGAYIPNSTLTDVRTYVRNRSVSFPH